VATVSIRLRDGIAIEIADASPSWPKRLRRMARHSRDPVTRVVVYCRAACEYAALFDGLSNEVRHALGMTC
jgi:hypothetical protein